MTARDDLDRQLDAFLRDGPTELPEPSFYAVRDRTDTTRQRVVIGPWRLPAMNKLVPAGIAAAALVAAVAIGAQSFGPAAPAGVGGAPSPSPSSAPSATPAPAASPFVWVKPTAAKPVRMSTNVPPGWTFVPEIQGLSKGDDNTPPTPPEAFIVAWVFAADTPFYVYGDPCQWRSTTPETPVTGVDEFAAALAAQASRDASTPVDVTIDGYSGKRLTLHVPTDAAIDGATFVGCDGGWFGSYGLEPGTEPERHHQGPGQIDELWILDVDGVTVVIDAQSRPDTAPELLDEIEAIVESITFG